MFKVSLAETNCNGAALMWQITSQLTTRKPRRDPPLSHSSVLHQAELQEENINQFSPMFGALSVKISSPEV